MTSRLIWQGLSKTKRPVAIYDSLGGHVTVVFLVWVIVGIWLPGLRKPTNIFCEADCAPQNNFLSQTPGY